jgi:hypothetical protein
MLLGAALLSVLVAACDSKPKEEHGAMTPAGTDMVAPETPAATEFTEPAYPNEGSSGRESESPADQSAPAETDIGSPPDSAPATNP